MSEKAHPAGGKWLAAQGYVLAKPLGSHSTAFQRLELVEGARPVLAQQARERAVGQELAAGLARRAVICFVGCVADPLDLGTAARAGLAVSPVNGHPLAKCCDFFGEPAAGLGAETIRPFRQDDARG